MQKKKRRFFYLFVFPGCLGIMVFVLLPFLDVVKRSFTTAVTGEFSGRLAFPQSFSASSLCVSFNLNRLYFIFSARRIFILYIFYKYLEKYCLGYKKLVKQAICYLIKSLPISSSIEISKISASNQRVKISGVLTWFS